MNYISLKEAAAIVGKSEKTIKRTLVNQKLPNDPSGITFKKTPANRGHYYFVDKESLLSFYQTVDQGKPKGVPSGTLSVPLSVPLMDALKDQIGLLKDRIESLENQLETKDQQINQLQILLLHQKQIEAPKKNRNLVDRVRDFLK